MSDVVCTSGRLHSEFVQLLFLQNHRESEIFFEVSGVQLVEHDRGHQFHFRRADFSSQIKIRVGPGKYGSSVAGTNETTCTPCGVGKYGISVASTNESTCLPCEMGKYSDILGVSVSFSGSVCTSCPLGTYLPTVRNDTATDCIPCNPG
jgi:hypothetical protein